jgi:hypothetical protein
MRKLLALALGAALLAAPAAAQVNTVPQTGVISSIQKRVTYSAVALALPPAASATDIACIAGSASKVISIRQIRISGSAGTLVSLPVTLVKRASLDTGGTAATTTANWANTVTKHDSTDPTATATLISYSANPTIVDTSPGYLRSDLLTLPTTAAGTTINAIIWEPDLHFSFPKGFVLRSATEQVCINLNAVSVSSGLLHISASWTED